MSQRRLNLKLKAIFEIDRKDFKSPESLRQNHAKAFVDVMLMES